nr:hypothetical protein [Brevibacillus laterosporus]
MRVWKELEISLSKGVGKEVDTMTDPNWDAGPRWKTAPEWTGDSGY